MDEFVGYVVLGPSHRVKATRDNMVNRKDKDRARDYPLPHREREDTAVSSGGVGRGRAHCPRVLGGGDDVSGARKSTRTALVVVSGLGVGRCRRNLSSTAEAVAAQLARARAAWGRSG